MLAVGGVPSSPPLPPLRGSMDAGAAGARGVRPPGRDAPPDPAGRDPPHPNPLPPKRGEREKERLAQSTTRNNYCTPRPGRPAYLASTQYSRVCERRKSCLPTATGDASIASFSRLVASKSGFSPSLNTRVV